MQQLLRSPTFSTDLAVTVGVTGLEEVRCLAVGQCSCTSLEVLQEQPVCKSSLRLGHPDQLIASE